MSASEAGRRAVTEGRGCPSRPEEALAYCLLCW